jgi:hypothetical protein
MEQHTLLSKLSCGKPIVSLENDLQLEESESAKDWKKSEKQQNKYFNHLQAMAASF